MDNQQALSRLHDALGLKRLNRLWAKLEILFGLSATGFGLLELVRLAINPGIAPHSPKSVEATRNARAYGF